MNPMTRLQTINPKDATGKAKELLDAVQAKLKITPNMTKVMANSPAVLEGYLSFSGALNGGALDPKVREQIALVVGQSNGCEYCLSAHTAIGKMVGLSEAEIADGRQGTSANTKNAAVLALAREIVEKRGIVPNTTVETARKAGLSDGEIAETIAHVALNVFTNYFNNVAEVDIDFPRVSLKQTA
jgi:uncharacterized peroxidase-related enzyme